MSTNRRDTSAYFNKKFSLECGGALPAAEVFFTAGNVEMSMKLAFLKSITNHVKSKLNNVDINLWSVHTKNRNPADLIVNHVKSLKAEFVTQAFCKFYECVGSYPLVDNVGEVFQSVHLCEAPGAFVSALNHYLRLKHPETEFRWRASTLNPYYEGNSISHTILDDRLISHTLDNWIFGDDYDGDILKERNVRSFIDYCRTLDKINLVTSDGSIDCNDEPDRQEEIVAPLHYAEFVTSLAILSDGGSMLLKMFTLYELSSWSLLYVLSCCFESLDIFKPATSKEGNSECYVIAIGYKKAVMTDEILEKLISNLTLQSEHPMLSYDHIPEAFAEAVYTIANKFMLLQVHVIENNIRTFSFYPPKENQEVWAIKAQMPSDWVTRFDFKQIKNEQKLVRYLHTNDINLNARGHQGSYSERQSFLDLSRNARQEFLIDRLAEFQADIDEINARHQNSALSMISRVETDEFINFIRGRLVERVRSSKFMLARLVKFLITVQTFEGEAEQPYEGNRYEIEENTFRVEFQYFKNAATYEEFEKDVIKKLLAFILESNHDEIEIFDLPMFAQFVVGVILFLSIYVFKVVHLARTEHVIRLKELRPSGKENLRILIDAFESNPDTTKAVLGITDTQRLFSRTDYYHAVIDYNNNLALRFCSLYLNPLDR